MPERNATIDTAALTNRERGYLLRLEDRCVILRARIGKGYSEAHFITEWKMELHALEWAIGRLGGQK